MPPEDHQPPLCFECDGELEEKDATLICDECGKIYTLADYQNLVDKEAEDYISYMKEHSPELFL